MSGGTLVDRDEIARLASSILAGEDRIEVPESMVDEEKGEEDAEGPAPRSMSLYAEIKAMSLPQRVKLAMKGNRESRNILLRDTNKMIQRMVLQNPRITEDEVLVIAKDRNADTELLRQIGDNRDWLSHYSIRSALVENARTPLAISLRLLKTLQDREIRVLSKSKNVASAVSGQARRMMFQKQQQRQGH